jgi:hypothetical protein
MEKEKAQTVVCAWKFLSIFRIAFLTGVLDTFGDFILSVKRRS